MPPEKIVQFYEDFVVSYIEERLDSSAGTGNPTWIEGTEELEGFVQYLDRTWVGKYVPGRNRRSAHRRHPLFAHDTWNVFLEIQKDEPILTNNSTGIKRWELILICGK